MQVVATPDRRTLPVEALDTQCWVLHAHQYRHGAAEQGDNGGPRAPFTTMLATGRPRAAEREQDVYAVELRYSPNSGHSWAPLKFSPR